MMMAFGDDRLAGEPTRRLKGQTAAAATVSPQGTLMAAVKTDDRADFEIGSVSKGLTGLLYAQALARG